MATLRLNGTATHTRGELPIPGRPTPDFALTTRDLGEITNVDLEGTRVLMNIFPSLDTATCAQSVRTFDRLAADLPDTVLLCISMDLPFAQALFCASEHTGRVVTASAFRHPGFGEAFGVALADGPMRGLLARAVVALDENGTVVYTELVSELTREPDYDAAVHALRNRHHPCPEDAALTTE